MSLKAKLEAVIYAAEEPVTLAQLTALFAADALEWKAEQEAASAELAADSANNPEEAPLSLLTGEFAYLEPDQAAADSAAPESIDAPQEPATEPVPEINPEPVPANAEAENPIPDAASGENPAPAAEVPTEADAKREARQRDREARAVIRQLLDELIATYAADSRGVEIREIAGGYRMATKPECHDAVRLFVKSLKPALKLSLPALETLAVIAYKQPVTAPEVNEIRGVDSSGVFGSLLARKLIATAGRKQVIGRPILYKTTREFLLRFGLKDVSELPSMEEFEKMAAIELDEPESVSEAEPETGLDFDQNGSDQPTDKPDPGAVPESAETPAEQETQVAELPAPMPAVTAAQNTAETPAVMAAEPAEPQEAEAPEAVPEPQFRPTDSPAANEPANTADSTPA